MHISNFSSKLIMIDVIQEGALDRRLHPAKEVTEGL